MAAASKDGNGEVEVLEFYSTRVLSNLRMYPIETMSLLFELGVNIPSILSS